MTNVKKYKRFNPGSYSDEEIKDIFKNFILENKNIVTYRDYTKYSKGKPGIPSVIVIYNRFNTYTEMIDICGLRDIVNERKKERNKNKRKNSTNNTVNSIDIFIKNFIKSVSPENTDIISEEDYKKLKIILGNRQLKDVNYSILINRFRSWNNVSDFVNGKNIRPFKATPKENFWNGKRILLVMTREFTLENIPKTQTSYVKESQKDRTRGFPDQKTIKRYFGSYYNFLEEFKKEKSKDINIVNTNVRKYSELEEYLINYIIKNNIKDFNTYIRHCNMSSIPKFKFIRKKYGSWDKFMTFINKEKEVRSRLYSNERDEFTRG